MQPATEATVAGDFADARFTYGDVTSIFSRRNGAFLARTDGPDGALRDYEIKYTFGVTPLQQYLVELADGRLQALGIAWDARPDSAGGQRWFHLYPGETLKAGDPLHWTGLAQNWNFMTTTAAPYRRTIAALCKKSASPSFNEIELTTGFPCTHFSPASMTDHLELSIMMGTRAISGSVAM